MKNETNNIDIFIFTSLDIKWLVKAREKRRKFLAFLSMVYVKYFNVLFMYESLGRIPFKTVVIKLCAAAH
jgi:hypothetical protein